VKLLVDACVAASAKIALARAGHEAESVADWDQDPGDLAILAHATEHRQTVITLDKDFGELAIVRGLPHRGILRLVDIRAADHGPAAVAAIDAHGAALVKGSIVTVEPGRVRVRPPESDDD
jgi:predicted nuclease of predicted toxin-antitoxin system